MGVFGVLKKFGLWSCAGFSDRMCSKVSRQKCSFALQVVAKLDQCEPWTDHFELSTIKSLNEAMKLKDFAAVRTLIDIGVKEDAVIECVELAKLAVDLIAHGSEITYEFFPCLE
jgi:hypothetical protein